MPGLKKTLMLALASAAIPAAAASSDKQGERPQLPELPSEGNGGLSRTAMFNILSNPGTRHGEAGEVLNEIFQHGPELKATGLGRAMSRYESVSVRTALMNADPCGEIALDPDQALAYCHHHPVVGALIGIEDPTAPGRAMPVKRPDPARSAEFNAAYLQFVQAYQNHIHLEYGLLPIFTIVEQLGKKWHVGGMTAHLRYFGGAPDSNGTHVFMDENTINHHPGALFDLMCHELGHVVTHPDWEKKMTEITGTQVPFANEVVADHFALEACGPRLGNQGEYQRAGGEKLYGLMLQAIVEQHQPTTDALLKANELVKMAFFDGDPQALKATGDAIVLVGKLHPELLKKFSSAGLPWMTKVQITLLSVAAIFTLHNFMNRDDRP